MSFSSEVQFAILSLWTHCTQFSEKLTMRWWAWIFQNSALIVKSSYTFRICNLGRCKVRTQMKLVLCGGKLRAAGPPENYCIFLLFFIHRLNAICGVPWTNVMEMGTCMNLNLFKNFCKCNGKWKYVFFTGSDLFRLRWHQCDAARCLHFEYYSYHRDLLSSGSCVLACR